MSEAATIIRTGRGTAVLFRSSLVTGIGFLVALAILHGLRFDLDPGMHFISEYEVGPSGWLMQLAFFFLGFACASFGVGLFVSRKSVTSVVAAVLLLTSASGMFLAAWVPPGPVPGLHDLGATLDMVPLAAIFVCLGWGHTVWKNRRWLLWLVGLVPLAGFVLYVTAMASVLPGLKWDPAVGAPVGWQNRVMVVAQAGWLIAFSWLQLRGRGQARRASSPTTPV